MSEQPSNHPQPKLSPVQSAVGCMHQESDSKAINKHARADSQPSQILFREESAIADISVRQRLKNHL